MVPKDVLDAAIRTWDPSQCWFHEVNGRMTPRWDIIGRGRRASTGEAMMVAVLLDLWQERHGLDGVIDLELFDSNLDNVTDGRHRISRPADLICPNVNGFTEVADRLCSSDEGNVLATLLTGPK